MPLEVQHVSGIAEVTDIEASMMALVRQGLVVGSQTRHRLADGVADRLRRMEDLKPWVNRAITYFTAWAERHRRSPDIVLENSEALLRVQQCAADARRWGEVLLLGRLVEGALVLGVRWGAWAIALERCLAAAKAIGDRSAEAWALHEIGTRALCVGDSARARAVLGQAVRLRESLQDEVAAAASRRNLRLVVASVSDDSSERSTMPFDVVRGIDSLPLRDAVQPAAPDPKAPSVTVLALTGLLSAIVGWFAYMAVAGALSMRAADAPSTAHGIAASKLAQPEEPPAAPAAPDLIATGGGPPVDTFATSGTGSRSGAYPHLHRTTRHDRGSWPRRTLLRGRRRLPGTHRPCYRRGQPDEHANVSSCCSSTHDDLRAHSVRSRRPSSQTAIGHRRQVDTVQPAVQGCSEVKRGRVSRNQSQRTRDRPRSIAACLVRPASANHPLDLNLASLGRGDSCARAFVAPAV